MPRKADDEPSLFDLPLDGRVPVEEEGEDRAAGARSTESGAEREPWGAGAGARRVAERPPPEEAPEPLELFDRSAEAPRGPAAAAGTARSREPAPLASRYLAGLADLAVHLALAVALLFGARVLGAAAGLADWPAIALFLVVFSFLYTVLPLAFWGQTPGMAWAGLVARSPGDANLAFGQSARRWLGGLLTAALLGLPALLAAGGRRSLADRLSDSDVFLT